jgi:hypothetical protein
MADVGFARPLGTNQLGGSRVRRCLLAITVFALTRDLVYHALKRAKANEATDHHAGAVGDHGNYLIARGCWAF